MIQHCARNSGRPVAVAPWQVAQLTRARLYRRIHHRPGSQHLAVPVAAALLPAPPPQPAAVLTVLASVVPTFPRIGGQPVRDWIAQGVEQLQGFNGDDLARLLFPDLVSLIDGPTLVIVWLLVLAFIYWEGGILLKQLRERQQRRREQQEDRGGSTAEGGALSPAEEQRTEPLLPTDPVQRARYERRRGLGYLALAAAFTIWMTGVVNGPSPFQP